MRHWQQTGTMLLSSTWSYIFPCASVDYIMRNRIVESNLLKTDITFLLEKLAIIYSSLTPVTKMTFKQHHWNLKFLSHITDIDISIQKVPRKLSIMELLSSLGMREVNIAIDAPIPCHTQSLHISIPILADIAADWLPNTRIIFPKQLGASGDELNSSWKLWITLCSWDKPPNNQKSVPLIFEA